MKKILVPCDFSVPALEAVKYAGQIAAKSGGEVLVLHIIDLPVIIESAFGIRPYLHDTDTLRAMQTQASENFEKIKQHISEEDQKMSFYIKRGEIATITRDFIKEHLIDLVIMAPHRTAGWKELFIGSNTEKILRESPVPVFTMKQSGLLNEINNIVFPTDLNLGQENLVNKVKELQILFDAHLHLLFVNTPAYFKREQKIKQDIEAFASHFKFKNFTTNVVSDLYEEYGIINFAKELKADLIAMGTHGRKGISHFLVGSIAEDVIQNVNCSVWTFRQAL